MRGAGGRVVAIAGGGDAAWLERELRAAAERGVAGVLSFGLAGALAPELRVGDWVVGEGVYGGLDCDAAWVRALSQRPPRNGEGIQAQHSGGAGAERAVCVGTPPPPPRWRTAVSLPDPGRIYADGTLATSAAAKRALHARTGALAIDMESHVAARVAADYGVPLAMLRVISDTADDALPPAFAVAMRPGGGTNFPAILASLATRPGQLPAFFRGARDATRALNELLRGRVLLGPRFLLPDAGERAADVV